MRCDHLYDHPEGPHACDKAAHGGACPGRTYRRRDRAYKIRPRRTPRALPGNRRVMTGGTHVSPGEPMFLWVFLQGEVVYALCGWSR